MLPLARLSCQQHEPPPATLPSSSVKQAGAPWRVCGADEPWLAGRQLCQLQASPRSDPEADQLELPGSY